MIRKPIFLERKGYRRRRMMDAVRILPAVGLGLWLIPLMWPQGDPPGAQGLAMSTALSYVFGVWLALIVICAGLWLRTRKDPDG